MKKLLVILTAAMLLLLAACSDEKDSVADAPAGTPSAEIIIEDETENNAVDKEKLIAAAQSAIAEKTPTPTPTPIPTPIPTAEPAVTHESEQEAEFTRGTVANNVYENRFMGFGCTFTESWTFYSDEELAELNNIPLNAMTDEILKALLETGSTVQDMFVTANGGAFSINVTYEDLGASGTRIDMEEYMDLSAAQLPQALEDIGMEDVEVHLGSIKFAGEDRDAIALTAAYSDVPMYEMLICIEKGDYVCIVTFCSMQENYTGAMTEMFYALEE